MKRLLETGADVQKVTKIGESTLEIAIKQGSYECVHLILEAGMQIEPQHIKIAKEVKSRVI
jgi:ankyrin repeat protein